MGIYCEWKAVVIAANDKWEWPQLADFSIANEGCSRAYWRDGVTPPAGLDGECLRRWNGLPGTVAEGSIQGPLVQQGRKLLWIAKPEAAVLVDVTQGTGHVLISQLAFRGRLDPPGPACDPMAERLLLYLLSG
jgi:hypothetical protein